MGHGARKNISSIPEASVVRILSAEGLLYDTQRKLMGKLRLVFSGDDSPEVWREIDRLRTDSVTYSRQYTTAILNLQREQDKT